eukprot:CAMPEP_0168377372 /NCGR_PEP_ID=MMETSP0228-20121227/10790_1 /TAXON_ID=133427 /ORGANISM="Protoceratium reticulatum, Strain CCCM 535 (=CCMP 1889)" /LENGTH=257 /DNA_ID=CAMNT_0008390363 /DNA_START=23 /DNA_END=798 /DNA_ORIENTATION=+
MNPADAMVDAGHPLTSSAWKHGARCTSIGCTLCPVQTPGSATTAKSLVQQPMNDTAVVLARTSMPALQQGAAARPPAQTGYAGEWPLVLRCVRGGQQRPQVSLLQLRGLRHVRRVRRAQLQAARGAGADLPRGPPAAAGPHRADATGFPWHTCDECQRRVEEGAVARCAACDYDLCPACASVAAAAAPERTTEPEDEAEDAEAEVPEGSECVICLVRASTHACVPCGHKCVCARCAGRVSTCPVCRAELQLVMRVYG